MTWADVDALAADGNEVGGHTLTQWISTSTSLSGDAEARARCATTGRT